MKHLLLLALALPPIACGPGQDTADPGDDDGVVQDHPLLCAPDYAAPDSLCGDQQYFWVCECDDPAPQLPVTGTCSPYNDGICFQTPSGSWRAWCCTG